MSPDLRGTHKWGEYGFPECRRGLRAVGKRRQDAEAVGRAYGQLRADLRGARKRGLLGIPQCRRALRPVREPWQDAEALGVGLGVRGQGAGRLGRGARGLTWKSSSPNKRPTPRLYQPFESLARRKLRRHSPAAASRHGRTKTSSVCSTPSAVPATAGCAPEGVRRELEKMAATWQGPPPLTGEEGREG